MGEDNSNVKFFVRMDSFFLLFRNRLSFTHEVARKAAIILRTSVSLRVVSSNPGVSIKTTRRPSRLKAAAGWTVFVQDRNPLPTPRLDPLTRLMNCVDHDRVR